jgi:hypothetical protein
MPEQRLSVQYFLVRIRHGIHPLSPRIEDLQVADLIESAPEPVIGLD